MNGFNNRIEMVEVKSANLETFEWNSPNLKNCESLDFKKRKKTGPQGPLKNNKIPNTLLSESQKEKGERSEKIFEEIM